MFDTQKGNIVEVVTNNYVYIGKVENIDSDFLYLMDALTIVIVPFQTDDGKISQMPRFEPRNLYSTGSFWRIPVGDIYYCEKLAGSKFVDMYETTLEGYRNLKISNSSDIEIVQNIPK